MQTAADKRRRKIFEFCLCVVLPCIIMALHYIVQVRGQHPLLTPLMLTSTPPSQGHRFDIGEFRHGQQRRGFTDVPS